MIPGNVAEGNTRKGPGRSRPCGEAYAEALSEATVRDCPFGRHGALEGPQEARHGEEGAGATEGSDVDKRFRIVMVPVKGKEEFAEATAPNADAALGLVANRHNWIGNPRTGSKTPWFWPTVNPRRTLERVRCRFGLFQQPLLVVAHGQAVT